MRPYRQNSTYKIFLLEGACSVRSAWIKPLCVLCSNIYWQNHFKHVSVPNECSSAVVVQDYARFDDLRYVTIVVCCANLSCFFTYLLNLK